MNEPSSTPSAAHTVGRYEVRSELGRGAMGVVFEAFDPVLHRLVALKTIRLHGVETAQARLFEERFLVEARIAARLQHPGIVVVHDVGRDELTGTLYIALELLRGKTLQERLNDGPLPWIDVVRMMARVARALDHAHAAGIIHRDIKPANVMILPSGEPKIMDFGIARVENALQTISVPGEFLGTPLYASPEQALGLPLDRRSDVFSLGAVAYSALVGRAAFTSSNVPEIVRKVIQVDPPPPSTQAPGLPPEIDAVLARALAKGPDDRYPTAADFAHALKGLLLSDEPLTLVPVPVPLDRDPLLELQTLVAETTLRDGAPAGDLPRAPASAEEQSQSHPSSRPRASEPRRSESLGDGIRLATAGETVAAPGPAAPAPAAFGLPPSPPAEPPARPSPPWMTWAAALAVLGLLASAGTLIVLRSPGTRPATGQALAPDAARAEPVSPPLADQTTPPPDDPKQTETPPSDPPAPREAPVSKPTPAPAKTAPPRRTEPLPEAPSPLPAPAPTQPVSSSEAPAADSAQLVVDFGHTLTQANLTVSVDGDVVIEAQLAARVKKTLGVAVIQGEFRRTVDVSPGKRRILVTLRYEGKTKTREIDGTFLPGKTRHLDVSLGRIRKNLDLEWK